LCTLACWIGTHPFAPLVVAANRDERLGRAASGPKLWPGELPLVAPVDEVAGGTWWAVNAAGLFVGLTNRAGANLDPLRRSRGQLVLDVARCRTLVEMEQLLRSIPAQAYNGFHLLAANGQAGVTAVDDGTRLTVSVLGPGRHIISERSFGASATSRDASVGELLAGIPSPDELQQRMGQHLSDPFQSLCVHLPDIDYGTRSSTILALGGSAPLLRYADGPPCVTPWTDQSGLLADLGV
jgi:uncharacterized protein with NRDE domain